MTSDKTVCVVDDEPATRRSFALLLESAGFPTRSFGSAEEFLSDCDPSTAACLVLDVRMGGMTGLDLLGELSARQWEIPAVMVSGYADTAVVVAAVRAGAVDFLEKPFREELLLARVRQLWDQQVEKRRRQASLERSLASLTPREHAVMALLVEGIDRSTIAETLGISPKTVDAHRLRILDKMDVDSVIELVRMLPLAARFGGRPAARRRFPAARPAPTRRISSGPTRDEDSDDIGE